MKCYECKWLDRSVILTSNPPQYGCTLGFGSHYADHECEYDFMPIVRCKDCRYAMVRTEEEMNKPIKPQPILCEWFCIGVENDDYCSYGERKEP